MTEEELIQAIKEEIREYLMLDDERLNGYGLIRAVLVKQLQDLNTDVPCTCA